METKEKKWLVRVTLSNGNIINGLISDVDDEYEVISFIVRETSMICIDGLSEGSCVYIRPRDVSAVEVTPFYKYIDRCNLALTNIKP